MSHENRDSKGTTTDGRGRAVMISWVTSPKRLSMLHATDDAQVATTPAWATRAVRTLCGKSVFARSGGGLGRCPRCLAKVKARSA